MAKCIVMEKTIVCQGRILESDDLDWLKGWVAANRHWSRHRLAKELCRAWDWRTANGRLKNFAARSLLIKLEQRGLIELPAVRKSMIRNSWNKDKTEFIHAPDSTPISSRLSELRPLTLTITRGNSFDEKCFDHYLARHHYLGFNRTVGENIKYLVRDRQGRELACLLFGAAAWKTAPRDQFIGWEHQGRESNLQLITNNTRFLILPWIEVPHLASHLLGLVTRRLSGDWQEKYGHPIQLVETFVERGLYKGTCYRAANWILVGQTKGRSRQDRYTTMKVPVKDVYLCPLTPSFREALCHVQP